MTAARPSSSEGCQRRWAGGGIRGDGRRGPHRAQLCWGVTAHDSAHTPHSAPGSWPHHGTAPHTGRSVPARRPRRERRLRCGLPATQRPIFASSYHGRDSALRAGPFERRASRKQSSTHGRRVWARRFPARRGGARIPPKALPQPQRRLIVAERRFSAAEGYKPQSTGRPTSHPCYASKAHPHTRAHARAHALPLRGAAGAERARAGRVGFCGGRARVRCAARRRASRRRRIRVRAARTAARRPAGSASAATVACTSCSRAPELQWPDALAALHPSARARSPSRRARSSCTARHARLRRQAGGPPTGGRAAAAAGGACATFQTARGVGGVSRGRVRRRPPA